MLDISRYTQFHCHAAILYDYVSHLSNLGHSRESIVTLAVPNYLNIPLVHSSPSPSKMNSKLSFLTATASFHVDLTMRWQGWRYYSTEHHHFPNTCRNYRTEPHPSVSLLLSVVTNTCWTHWLLLLRDNVSWLFYFLVIFFSFFFCHHYFHFILFSFIHFFSSHISDLS